MNSCPHCGCTDELTAWPSELITIDEVVVVIECAVCRTLWSNIYRLSSFKDVHTPKEGE